MQYGILDQILEEKGMRGKTSEIQRKSIVNRIVPMYFLILNKTTMALCEMLTVREAG